MKQIYTIFREVKIILKDGHIIETNSDVMAGRYIYHYGEMPTETTEIYTENLFLHLRKFELIYDYRTTLFKGQKLAVWCPNSIEKIYTNDIDKIEVRYSSKVADAPSWKYLREDLGFYDLSELIFNREQELRAKLLEEELY